MAKVIIESGGTYRIGDDKRFTIHQKLPVGVYQTHLDMFGNIFLEQTDDFTITHKLYGSTNRRAERIMTSFKQRNRPTGVLLSGDKGSGKTLLAKRVAEMALGDGFPVIISTPHVVRSGGYVDFMNELKFPVINILDEFEKMFEENDQQNSLLTLFDGVMSAEKRLFILTVNEPRKVNDYFHSRPGRILYKYSYRGVEEEAAEEFLKDCSAPESFINEFKIYHKMNPLLSFDSVSAIIEEYHRFGNSFKDTIEGLNISDFDNVSWRTYDVSIFIKQLNLELPCHTNTRIRDLGDYGFHIHNYFKYKRDEDGDETGEVDTEYKVSDQAPYAKEVNKLPLETRKIVHKFIEQASSIYAKSENFQKLEDDGTMIYADPVNKVFIKISPYVAPVSERMMWD